MAMLVEYQLSSYLFLNQSAMALSSVTRIKPKEDDISLINDFVQHSDVVSSPLLFLCLVELDRAKEMKLPNADSVSWASKESIRHHHHITN
jgi:hypothetical protein